MRIILFGATGMVGQGVLRECLRAPDVTAVLAVGRSASGVAHPRLAEAITPDLHDLAPIEAQLQPYDACFFCLGVSVAGLSEAAYARLTHDLTLAAAERLARLNPAMTFVYVSGAGTDASEGGRVMWARVKGRTENALLRLPFKGVYLFRPGLIEPMHGERSKTTVYRIAYAVLKPLTPLLRRWLGDRMLTTELVGRAMLDVARRGAPRPVLEIADIAAQGRAAPPPAQAG